MRSTRSGALAPSHWPTIPPIDNPHQLICLDAESVEHRQYVAAEPLHAVWSLGNAGLAVAAPVVTDQTEVLGEGLHLSVPHGERGAERIRQHEYGRPLGALDFDMDRAAVGVDDRHGIFLVVELVA